MPRYSSAFTIHRPRQEARQVMLGSRAGAVTRSSAFVLGGFISGLLCLGAIGCDNSASRSDQPEEVTNLEETIETTRQDLEDNRKDVEDAAESQVDAVEEKAENVADATTNVAKKQKEKLVAWIEQKNAEVDRHLAELEQSLGEVPDGAQQQAAQIDERLQVQREKLNQRINDLLNQKSVTLEQMESQLQSSYDAMLAAITDANERLHAMRNRSNPEATTTPDGEPNESGTEPNAANE